MSIHSGQDTILYQASVLLQTFRCGFKNCRVKFEYVATHDEVYFVAYGNNGLYFHYNLGNRLPLDYKNLLIDLVPVWSDPIC